MPNNRMNIEKMKSRSIFRLFWFVLIILFLYNIIVSSQSYAATIVVKSISVDKTQLNMVIGETVDLKINVLPENATNKKTKFSIDDIRIIKISDTGTVTALRAGKAKISVTSLSDTKIKAVCSVNVSKPEKRVVTDMIGRKVTIPYTVNRVCSSGTAQNQLMLFLGAGSKICATLPSFKSNPWVQKVYPGIVNAISAFPPSGIDMELLIKSKPDVVTLWTGTEAIQKKLDEVGIPYVIIAYSTNDEFKKGIKLMGEVLGSAETQIAQRFVKYYDNNLNKISTVTDKFEKDKRKKVLYVTSDPLSTEGRDSLVTSWINISGGLNVAAENGINDLTATVSMESINSWNPDVIIVRDAPVKDLILKDDRWKSIKAIKDGNIFINPKGVNVWSARSADGALQPLWAAKTMYPELFKKINIELEVKKFYKTYYHLNINDTEMKDILFPKK